MAGVGGPPLGSAHSSGPGDAGGTSWAHLLRSAAARKR
jgi:hypothetical protein